MSSSETSLYHQKTHYNLDLLHNNFSRDARIDLTKHTAPQSTLAAYLFPFQECQPSPRLAYKGLKREVFLHHSHTLRLAVALSPKKEFPVSPQMR